MSDGLRVRVPGKLLLAGEYAILTPGATALVLAVDRYLEVELQPAAEYALASDLLPEAWTYRPETLTRAEAPPDLRFAAAALELGWRACAERLAARPPFALTIRSQLHTTAAKLGLGSSAAVCVGVLAVLLAAAGEDLGAAELRRRLYKLALLAHRGVQGSGSGADLAGCIFGSVTAYTSPDFARLPLQQPLQRLLAQSWPLLGLERLAWPSDWPALRFGWSGEAAGTAGLIADFVHWQQRDPDACEAFLFESSLGCLGLREALLSRQLPRFVEGVGRARRLLQRLDAELAGDDALFAEAVPRRETPTLAALADAAEALGGAGKFSGAGGGDCGLAWVPPAAAAALEQAWRDAGITPLTLGLDSVGVRCEPVSGT